MSKVLFQLWLKFGHQHSVTGLEAIDTCLELGIEPSTNLEFHERALRVSVSETFARESKAFGLLRTDLSVNVDYEPGNCRWGDNGVVPIELPASQVFFAFAEKSGFAMDQAGFTHPAWEKEYQRLRELEGFVGTEIEHDRFDAAEKCFFEFWGGEQTSTRTWSTLSVNEQGKDKVSQSVGNGKLLAEFIVEFKHGTADVIESYEIPF